MIHKHEQRDDRAGQGEHRNELNHIRVLVESFADEPRKFYRKIRNMFNKRADGLTAVYKNGTKSATSDPHSLH